MITEKEIEELRKKIGYDFKPELMKDGKNRFWTKGLFYEMSYGKEDRVPIFTFKPVDFKDCYSFKRLFVELNDPTGYLPAMVLLNSWDHWKKLCDLKWFRTELGFAMEELEIKLRAAALLEIKDISKGNSGSALQAAKYLAEGKWKDKALEPVGRPKKWNEHLAKQKQNKIIQLVSEDTESDYERLGLGQD